MMGKVRVGPSTCKGPRPASDEDRELLAAYVAGETYAAIARRIRHSAEWVRKAVDRAHLEAVDARLKAAGA